MQRAYEQMPKQDSYVLIDAIDPAFLPAKGEGVVKGDAQSYAIAAASIFGKGNARCTDEGLRIGLSWIWMGAK